MVTSPHYLLFSHTTERHGNGHWRFVLEAADGSARLVADDVEPNLRGERLQLFTVVRGLEALGQPSRVTLLTPSSYVREGIRYGLSEWRRNGWRWERFGRMVPVRNRCSTEVSPMRATRTPRRPYCAARWLVP